MVDISNEGIITLSRGDTFRFPLFINKGTEIAPIRYELTENDMLYFAIMEPNQRFEDAIIRKVYTTESEFNEDGDVMICIDPTDTEYLLGGKYYYEVKLRTLVDTEHPEEDNSYTVQTIIPKRGFQLLGLPTTPIKATTDDPIRGTIAVPIEITENGTFTPPKGKVFNKVTVNVKNEPQSNLPTLSCLGEPIYYDFDGTGVASVARNFYGEYASVAEADAAVVDIFSDKIVSFPFFIVDPSSGTIRRGVGRTVEMAHALDDRLENGIYAVSFFDDDDNKEAVFYIYNIATQRYPNDETKYAIMLYIVAGD